ncbi:hypothetical protein LZC95_34530 [Pendulispora brunnea]|uniref:Novel STAND NTPase 1 domain-containing protein n=1 Tax=Pendulispora brunnea TaxID=2905690 RepID=A0ABZ2JYJ0_9BACT
MLTALHVLGRVEKGQLAFHGRDLQLTAAVREGESFRFPVCEPRVEDIQFDERLDWACINVGSALSGADRLHTGELTDSDREARWHAYGFPGNSPDDGTATAGTVTTPSAMVTLRGNKVSAIQLFSQEAAAGAGGVVHGYSGGPVIVDDRVIGILVAASVDEETGHAQHGTLYALPLSAVGISLPKIECPYPGLRPFEPLDAARNRFFGRDAETEQVLERLRNGERQIVVVGPSGSGKSSFVRAGLVPRLPQLDPRIVVRSLRPGARPLERLLQTLGDPAGAKDGLDPQLEASPDGGIVLIIDQLEELFTQCEDDIERRRFAVAYGELRRDPRFRLILTVRADFYGELIDSALWPHLSEQSYRLELAPLRGPQLAAAIEGPARALGVVVEEGLRENLLADAALEPGVLPLLQVTLRYLWEKRKRNVLRLNDYNTTSLMGRNALSRVLENTADAVLHRLTPEQQIMARRIFLRLVSFGEGRAHTRRQQTIDALKSTADDAAQFEATLDKLTSGTLITRDIKRRGEELIEIVDMAHEALISDWRKLAGWIKDRSADEQRRRTLDAEVQEWIAHGRDTVGLLDHVQLAEAEAWVKSDAARDVGYAKDLTDFLATSRRVIEDRERRRLWRTRITIGGLAVFSAGLTWLSCVANREALKSRQQAKVAEEQKLEARRVLGESYMEQGRQLVVEGRPQRALPFLVAAREQGIENNALKLLFAGARPLAKTWFVGHSDVVRDVGISPDGTRVVTASQDKTARIWDAITGKPITPPLQHGDWVRAASFSPDGTRIVTASNDQTARVWDALTGKPLGPPLPHRAVVDGASFSFDGSRVVTASADETVRVWDATTGEPITPRLNETRNRVVLTARMSVAFSPDGKRIVAASISEKTVQMWDAVTGQPLKPSIEESNVYGLRFSPDGASILTASLNHVATLWDVKTGRALTPPLTHLAEIYSAVFSADGLRVVTASADHTARVWDVKTGQPLTPYLRHDDSVVSASFSPDGTRIVTASTDKTARVWDVSSAAALTPSLEHQGFVNAAVFSSDGTRVVTASDDKTARVWEIPHPSAIGRPASSDASLNRDATRLVTAGGRGAPHAGHIWDSRTGIELTPPLAESFAHVARFSPDGTRVVTAGGDKTARVWDATTGQPVTPPLEHDGSVDIASFSPDGARIVTGSHDKNARIWDARTGQLIAPPLQHEKELRAASFSPDGSRVVTASNDSTARVWDAATGKPITGPLKHDLPLSSAHFSPDGTRVLTSSYDGTARIWDATTGQPVISPIKHDNAVLDASFSPDGLRVVTASRDRTARIWDAQTGKPLTLPLLHQGEVRKASFSPDGTRVVTGSADKTVLVWDASSGKPLILPFTHATSVTDVSFSFDGACVVSTGFQEPARIWPVPLDQGTLEQWQNIARCDPYVLQRGRLEVQTPPDTCWASPSTPPPAH